MRNLLLLAALILVSCGDSNEYPNKYDYAGYRIISDDIVTANNSGEVIQVTNATSSNFADTWGFFVDAFEFPEIESITLESDNLLTLTTSAGESLARMYERQGAQLSAVPLYIYEIGTDSLKCYFTLEASISLTTGALLDANFVSLGGIVTSAKTRFERKQLMLGDTLSFTAVEIFYTK